MIYNIAIDGPAGAGKSTIAKKVAGELSCVYVDTGAMYRAMALYLLRRNVNRENPDEIGEACQGAEISIEYKNGEQIVVFCGEYVLPFGASMNVVMDGRDIGTTILPNAEVKIYLTASSFTRAKRRYLELQEKGLCCDLEEIRKDIEERDSRDMNREISPLKQAEDAVLVDSSEMTIEEVVKRILQIFHEKVILSDEVGKNES